MTTDLKTPDRWYALDAAKVVSDLGSDQLDGLASPEASNRLRDHGPNEIKGEPLPSKLEIARHQIVDPMNLMLIGVAVISAVIGEFSTAVFVGALVCLNVLLGGDRS